MPAMFDRNAVRSHLEHFALQSLFIEELGWDHGGIDIEVPVRGRTFALHAVAHKRGLVAYQCVAASADTFPDHPTRQKIEKAVAKRVCEHLIVYTTHDRSTQARSCNVSPLRWTRRKPSPLSM